MAAISSSTSNSSSLRDSFCANSMVSFNIGNSILVLRTILLLPVCTFVLYLGHKRWRRQRSFKTTNHSDMITYHQMAMSPIWSLGVVCSLCGTYAILPKLRLAAVLTTFFVFYGDVWFNVLTCVERYLAVVHPLIYLGLKNERGARFRNIGIACVWLLSIGMIGVTAHYLPGLPIAPIVGPLVFASVVVSFCSLSSLCVLIRPGPGDKGGEKKKVDQSKQRAFFTILAITGMLWLWFAGLIISLSLYDMGVLSENHSCIIMSCLGVFNVPASLVLPLLYLHREGKLLCC
ncbi:hypothetical protein NQZ68_018178 [Dissostichus eleginoides]|nr:hypothetical protein NQZ68_018178 [Dissostichus eleginoides]